MSQATTPKRWTFDEYLTWESRQPTKHELGDGEARATVGGTARHDLICQTFKLRDYDSVGSIAAYVLISQDEPRVLVYRRDDAGRLGARAAELIEGFTAAVTLADPAITLPCAALYQRIEFPPDPLP